MAEVKSGSKTIKVPDTLPVTRMVARGKGRPGGSTGSVSGSSFEMDEEIVCDLRTNISSLAITEEGRMSLEQRLNGKDLERSDVKEFSHFFLMDERIRMVACSIDKNLFYYKIVGEPVFTLDDTPEVFHYQGIDRNYILPNTALSISDHAIIQELKLDKEWVNAYYRVENRDLSFARLPLDLVVDALKHRSPIKYGENSKPKEFNVTKFEVRPQSNIYHIKGLFNWVSDKDGNLQTQLELDIPVDQFVSDVNFRPEYGGSYNIANLIETSPTMRIEKPTELDVKPAGEEFSRETVEAKPDVVGKGVKSSFVEAPTVIDIGKGGAQAKEEEEEDQSHHARRNNWMRIGGYAAAALATVGLIYCLDRGCEKGKPTTAPVAVQTDAGVPLKTSPIRTTLPDGQLPVLVPGTEQTRDQLDATFGSLPRSPYITSEYCFDRFARSREAVMHRGFLSDEITHLVRPEENLGRIVNDLNFCNRDFFNRFYFPIIIPDVYDRNGQDFVDQQGRPDRTVTTNEYVFWMARRRHQRVPTKGIAVRPAPTGPTSPLVSPLIDTDGDGVPDSTDTDDDGDTYSDAEEIAARSNALDPGSVPTLAPTGPRVPILAPAPTGPRERREPEGVAIAEPRREPYNCTGAFRFINPRRGDLTQDVFRHRVRQGENVERVVEGFNYCDGRGEIVYSSGDHGNNIYLDVTDRDVVDADGNVLNNLVPQRRIYVIGTRSNPREARPEVRRREEPRPAYTIDAARAPSSAVRTQNPPFRRVSRDPLFYSNRELLNQAIRELQLTANDSATFRYQINRFGDVLRDTIVVEAAATPRARAFGLYVAEQLGKREHHYAAAPDGVYRVNFVLNPPRRSVR